MAELIAYYGRPLREPALYGRSRRSRPANCINDAGNTRLYDRKFSALSYLAGEDVVFLPESSSRGWAKQIMQRNIFQCILYCFIDFAYY